jgi:hypothetical protein
MILVVEIFFGILDFSQDLLQAFNAFYIMPLGIYTLEILFIYLGIVVEFFKWHYFVDKNLLLSRKELILYRRISINYSYIN